MVGRLRRGFEFGDATFERCKIVRLGGRRKRDVAQTDGGEDQCTAKNSCGGMGGEAGQRGKEAPPQRPSALFRCAGPRRRGAFGLVGFGRILIRLGGERRRFAASRLLWVRPRLVARVVRGLGLRLYGNFGGRTLDGRRRTFARLIGSAALVVERAGHQLITFESKICAVHEDGAPESRSASRSSSRAYVGTRTGKPKGATASAIAPDKQ